MSQALQNLPKHNLAFHQYDEGERNGDRTSHIEITCYKTKIIENAESVNITYADDMFYENVQQLMFHIISKAKNANYVPKYYIKTFVEVKLTVFMEIRLRSII